MTISSQLNFLISVISILISVAFYTILERKILSYIQIRKGPNKVGLAGILQPFSDAVKLFNKTLILTELMNSLLSTLSPALAFFMAMLIITVIPLYGEPNFDNKFSIITFMVISSLSVYFILLIGWSSNSKYAHLGAIRSMAQMISYEVSFFLMILFLVIMSSSFHFTSISESQVMMWFIFGNFIIFMTWIISCLAEVNRSPFDFAEGESELVSGFNIEYMGGWFALIFLAEYSNMIILSFITIILFMNSLKTSLSIIVMLILTINLLWIRGTMPRFRFDLLMSLSWKLILPITLFLIPLSFIMTIVSL